MTEALSGGSPDWGIEPFEQEKKTEYSYLSYQNGKLITCYARDPLHQAICRALEAVDEASSNRMLRDEIHRKLQEIGMTNFEKTLGSGGSGEVMQIKGENNTVAFKLIYRQTPIADQSQELQSDAIGLALPPKQHLGRAFALLTFDGNELHYIEQYDPREHAHHFLVGVLSKVVDGFPLGWHPLDFHLESVRGYGKRLAEALLALHAKGYAHCDFTHLNVLIKNMKEGKDFYRVKVIDFGCTEKITSENEKNDWKDFGSILNYMNESKQLDKNLDFHDLLYSKERGLVEGERPYSGDEILCHPFFV